MKPKHTREKFKQLRKCHGTQNEVGAAVGVSGTMIRYIENGYASPSGKLMLKLSNFFGVPANVLFPDIERMAIEEVSSCS